MSVMMKMRMTHERDPKEVLFEQLGGREKEVELFGARVLVATYRRPDKTEAGIYLPDKIKDEDLYQGTVGLVIGLGPLAFKDSEGVIFSGKRLEVGDWCFFTPAEGKAISINGVHCRIFDDVRIHGRVSEPDLVF